MSADILSDDRPVDPDDELLVAYLDGELDGKARGDVEQRLMDDELLRHRLRSLQTGWDWLDDLPDVEPSEKLVESTMELVVADLEKPEQKMKGGSWVKRWRWPLATAAACLLGSSIVWSAILLSRERAYQDQLRDLAIAENLDAYLLSSNLKLMRELGSNPDWDEMVASARAVGNLQVDLTTSIADVPQREREVAIDEMPVESRTQLAARWDRFSRLSEADLTRVRQTAAEVAVQPDPESLVKTMQVYAVWRELLPREIREEIQSDDVATRRRAITKAIDFTKTEVSRRSGNLLPEDPAIAMEPILFVLKRIVEDKLRFVEPAEKLKITAIERATSEEQARLVVMMTMLSRDEWRADRMRRGPPVRLRLPSITDSELLQIKLMLPDDVLEDQFFELTFGDPEYEALVLRAWADEAVRRKFDDRPDGETTMLQRYMEMDARDRERLDLLPPSEILRELSSSRRWRGGGLAPGGFGRPGGPGGPGFGRSGPGPGPRRER